MIDKVDDHKEVEQDLALINYKFDKCMNVLQNLYFEHQNQLFSLDSIERKKIRMDPFRNLFNAFKIKNEFGLTIIDSVSNI
jgi:hypothetical protein